MKNWRLWFLQIPAVLAYCGWSIYLIWNDLAADQMGNMISPASRTEGPTTAKIIACGVTALITVVWMVQSIRDRE